MHHDELLRRINDAMRGAHRLEIEAEREGEPLAAACYSAAFVNPSEALDCVKRAGEA